MYEPCGVAAAGTPAAGVSPIPISVSGSLYIKSRDLTHTAA